MYFSILRRVALSITFCIFSVGAFAQNYDPRIEHLEIEIRRLTGEVETLKYKNLRFQKEFNRFKEQMKIELEIIGGEMKKEPPKKEEDTSDSQNIKSIIRGNSNGSASVIYDAAQSELQRKKYAEAQKGFEKIIKQYPNDKLAPNAYYWLGETFYARKDYNKAAIHFLEGKRKHPTSQKAGHSLYKLGMSLFFLGEKKEACYTFNEVKDSYLPQDPSLRSVLATGMSRAGCS